MKFIVYKITNKVNGKIYVGAHATKNLDDGYMGSGKAIKRAIDKYGDSGFTKEILHELSSSEEMFAKEREIVNEEFVARKDTYNLVVGGFGLSVESAARVRAELLERRKEDPEFDEKLRAIFTRNARKANAAMKKKLAEDPEYAAKMVVNGQNASKKLLEKIKADESFAQAHRARAQQAVKNAHEQVKGSQWMSKPDENKELFVKPEKIEVFLRDGWILGRTKKPDQKTNSEKLTGRKRMFSAELNESKMVISSEVEQYLANGWILGMKAETKRPRPKPKQIEAKQMETLTTP